LSYRRIFFGPVAGPVKLNHSRMDGASSSGPV